jgi:hypothetical protein
MLDFFKSSTLGGQEGLRPIIYAKLLFHLSFTTFFDQIANTIIVVS